MIVKGKFVVLFFIWVSFIFGGDLFDEGFYEDECFESLKTKKHLVISLGYDCSVALNLQHSGLRFASFPLDWVLSKYVKGIVDLIEDEFTDIVNFSHIKKIQSRDEFDLIPKGFLSGQGYLRRKIEKNPIILNEKYGVFLPHLVPNKHKYQNSLGGLVSIDKKYDSVEALIKEKYKRRARRFDGVMKLGIPIYFIRYEASEEEALLLRDGIKSKYPEVDFRIIVINKKCQARVWSHNSNIFHEILGPGEKLTVVAKDVEEPFRRILKKYSLLYD